MLHKKKKCLNVVFFSKKQGLLKVFFQVQKWSSFGLIFMKLCLPEKIGDTGKVNTKIFREGLTKKKVKKMNWRLNFFFFGGGEFGK